MKIPTPTPTPTLWPSSRQAVLDVALSWQNNVLVKIDDRAIAALQLPAITPGLEAGMIEGKGSMSIGEAADLALALGSLNYRFWEPEGAGIRRYTRNGLVGANAMRAAFESAWADPSSPLSLARDQGRPLGLADVHHVFGDIPDPGSRVAILNEVLLSGERQRLTLSMTRSSRFDVATAAQLAEAFPLAYGDPVLKKAQLAVSDVWALAANRDPSTTCDLTAFADYQIPNILRAMGVLSYTPDLATAIDSFALIAQDSPQERALRAAAILAVEQIAIRAGAPVAAVDHYLWTRRNEAKTPFHLTPTTAY